MNLKIFKKSTKKKSFSELDIVLSNREKKRRSKKFNKINLDLE